MWTLTFNVLVSASVLMYYVMCGQAALVVTEGYYEVIPDHLVDSVFSTVYTRSLKTCTMACNQLMTSQSACTSATFNTATLECHLSASQDRAATQGGVYKTVRNVNCKFLLQDKYIFMSFYFPENLFFFKFSTIFRD